MCSMHSFRKEGIRVIVDEIRQFMAQLVEDREHAYQAEKLSLQLFDHLGEIHGCDLENRCLLQCAALVHDIGLTVSYQKHHKHSLQIILNAEFDTVTRREQSIIANIARYHRKSFPKLEHHEFLALGGVDQQVVRKMSAILRIADALDRTHRSAVREIRCFVEKQCCHCTLFADDKCIEEKARAAERKDLFRHVYGINFNIAHVLGDRDYNTKNSVIGCSENNILSPS